MRNFPSDGNIAMTDGSELFLGRTVGESVGRVYVQSRDSSGLLCVTNYFQPETARAIASKLNDLADKAEADTVENIYESAPEGVIYNCTKIPAQYVKIGGKWHINSGGAWRPVGSQGREFFTTKNLRPAS